MRIQKLRNCILLVLVMLGMCANTVFAADYPFVARRLTQSSAKQILTSSNATIYAIPLPLSGADSSKIACTYQGDVLYQWTVPITVSGRYMFVETGGSPDSVLNGMANIPIFSGTINGDIYPDWVIASGGLNIVDDTIGFWTSDSLFSEPSGWFHNRLKVGQGLTTSQLKVDGSIVVTGTATMSGATFSAEVALGASATEGKLKMWDGSANTILIRPGSTAANDTLTLPPTRAGYKDSLATMAYSRTAATPCVFLRPDTVRLSTARAGASDRIMSKYMPGALENDMVFYGALNLSGSAASLKAVAGGCYDQEPDSICITWTSAYDNQTTSFLVSRNR